MEPAIISDLFRQEERGTPVALTVISSSFGPLLAPVIGSFRQRLALGFLAYSHCKGIIRIVVYYFFTRNVSRQDFDFSRPSVYGKTLATFPIQSEYQILKGRVIIKQGLLKSAQLFFFSPIVGLLSLYMAIMYGFLFLMFTTETQIFQNLYGSTEVNVGSFYIGQGMNLLFFQNSPQYMLKNYQVLEPCWEYFFAVLLLITLLKRMPLEER